MRRLPNILSFSRIGLSLALLLASEKPLAFTALYLLCGVTDVLDGYLARKWQAESRLGSKLDSLGDFIFWAMVFWLLCQSDIVYEPYLFWLLTPVVLLRGINLIITRLKFNQWGMLHTYGNKAAGLLLYIAVPACYIAEHIPVAVGVLVGAAALLSAAEECAILLAAKKYNPDEKSFFIK